MRRLRRPSGLVSLQGFSGMRQAITDLVRGLVHVLPRIRGGGSIGSRRRAYGGANSRGIIVSDGGQNASPKLLDASGLFTRG